MLFTSQLTWADSYGTITGTFGLYDPISSPIKVLEGTEQFFLRLANCDEREFSWRANLPQHHFHLEIWKSTFEESSFRNNDFGTRVSSIQVNFPLHRTEQQHKLIQLLSSLLRGDQYLATQRNSSAVSIPIPLYEVVAEESLLDGVDLTIAYYDLGKYLAFRSKEIPDSVTWLFSREIFEADNLYPTETHLGLSLEVILENLILREFRQRAQDQESRNVLNLDSGLSIRLVSDTNLLGLEFFYNDNVERKKFFRRIFEKNGKIYRSELRFK